MVLGGFACERADSGAGGSADDGTFKAASEESAEESSAPCTDGSSFARADAALMVVAVVVAVSIVIIGVAVVVAAASAIAYAAVVAVALCGEREGDEEQGSEKQGATEPGEMVSVHETSNCWMVGCQARTEAPGLTWNYVGRDDETGFFGSAGILDGAMSDEAASNLEGAGQPAKKTMDIAGIMALLPHRYPFLLIDRVLELERQVRIVALKNVTMNEPQFQGHFPDYPIMPGVLMVEAMAQAGCVLLLTELPDPANKLVLFTGIEDAKFRRPVVPGDQLRIQATVINWRSRGAKMRGEITVDGKLVCDATILCQVVPRVRKVLLKDEAGA